jgi:hypothetical protein
VRSSADGAGKSPLVLLELFGNTAKERLPGASFTFVPDPELGARTFVSVTGAVKH